MAKFTPEMQAAFDQTAKEFNQILPNGIPTTFKTVYDRRAQALPGTCCAKFTGSASMMVR